MGILRQNGALIYDISKNRPISLCHTAKYYILLGESNNQIMTFSFAGVQKDTWVGYGKILFTRQS